jgi:hypothetical protein
MLSWQLIQPIWGSPLPTVERCAHFPRTNSHISAEVMDKPMVLQDLEGSFNFRETSIQFMTLKGSWGFERSLRGCSGYLERAFVYDPSSSLEPEQIWICPQLYPGAWCHYLSLLLALETFHLVLYRNVVPWAVILALRRYRQEDYEFEVSLG